MTDYRLDRATIVLGVAAMVAALGVFVKYRSDTRGSDGPARVSTLAGLTATTTVILLVLGALAVLGGLLGSRIGQMLAAAAGLGMAAAGGLKLLQDLFDFELLDVSRSAMALLGGLAIGLLALALTPRGESEA